MLEYNADTAWEEDPDADEEDIEYERTGYYYEDQDQDYVLDFRLDDEDNAHLNKDLYRYLEDATTGVLDDISSDEDLYDEDDL